MPTASIRRTPAIIGTGQMNQRVATAARPELEPVDLMAEAGGASAEAGRRPRRGRARGRPALAEPALLALPDPGVVRRATRRVPPPAAVYTVGRQLRPVARQRHGTGRHRGRPNRLSCSAAAKRGGHARRPSVADSARVDPQAEGHARSRP